MRLRGERHDLRPDLRAVPPLRDAFLYFLRRGGEGGESLDRWALCFTEAANNAIRHGLAHEAMETIGIEWEADETDIRLRVSQRGPGPTADRRADPRLPDDPYATGGRGLFIIHQLCAEVVHSDRDTGYVLCLRSPRAAGFLPADATDYEGLPAVLDELSHSYESLASFQDLATRLAENRDEIPFIASSLRDVASTHALRALRVALVSPRLPADGAGTLPPGGEISVQAPEAFGGWTEQPDEGVWVQAADAPAIARALSLAKGGGCLLPIAGKTGLWGALIASLPRDAGRVGSPLLNQLRVMAGLFAIALDNAALRRERDAQLAQIREIELATEIQHDLLPLPEIPFHPACAIYCNRRSHHAVGGDHVGLWTLPDGSLFLAIYDVMGKGVSAAMLASIFRFSLELCLEDTPPDPVDIARRLDRLLHRMFGRVTSFVTAVLGILSADGKTLDYVNAGHCPLLFIAPDGELDQGEAGGPPLGLGLPDQVCSFRRALGAGSQVLMVTDGCYEWNDGGLPFGWTAFCELVRDRLRGDPAAFWDEVLPAARVAADHDPRRGDDETILHLGIRA